jgi:hypothetical protein
MKRALIAAALAAASLPQAFNQAAAQPDAARHRMLMTLERLAGPQPVPNATLVTRSASVSVTGKVQIVSLGIVGPLFCSVSFSYSDSATGRFHRESKTNQIAVVGKTGTCSISVPFKWQNVTDFLDVPISVAVSNLPPTGTGEPEIAQLLTTSQFDGPTLPLPLQGADTHFTFDIRI